MFKRSAISFDLEQSLAVCSTFEKQKAVLPCLVLIIETAISAEPVDTRLLHCSHLGPKPFIDKQ